MSKNKLSSMIAAAAQRTQMEKGYLEKEAVYDTMMEMYGNEVFEHERTLATTAVKQKVKAHIRKSFSLSATDDGTQLSLLKDTLPPTFAVKSNNGEYRYVPMHLATSADVDAVLEARRQHVVDSQEKYTEAVELFAPVRPVMDKHKVLLGEAAKLLADMAKKKKASAPKKEAPVKPKAQRRRAKA